MPPPLADLEIDDEDYASSEDSDFAPDEAAAGGDEGDGDSSAGSEDDEAQGGNDTTTKEPLLAAAALTGLKKKKREQAGDGDGAEDAGFENSGDEAIIGKGKKRRKKAQQQQQARARADLDDDEEGGEGGLIKTRSMRAVEKAERKAQAVTGPVTVDVDALWASMTAAPAVPTTRQDPPTTTTKDGDGDGTAGDPSSQAHAEAGRDLQIQQDRSQGGYPSEMIRIKRTYNFAGKVHTEEKVVARDSAEARLYLASHPEAAASSEQQEEEQEQQDKDKRVPRKAYRSVFEPVLGLGGGGGGDQQHPHPYPYPRRTDLNLAIASRLRAREEAEAAAKAKKLNTVEKSRMDWAGFVDKEGIKDELALAGRAKGSFADRQDFLARSEARREEEARRVRLAGKG